MNQFWDDFSRVMSDPRIGAGMVITGLVFFAVDKASPDTTYLDAPVELLGWALVVLGAFVMVFAAVRWLRRKGEG